MIEQIQAAPDALPIVRQCELAGVSRATYYRRRRVRCNGSRPTRSCVKPCIVSPLKPQAMATAA
jgi:hypothetical protein